MINPSGVLLWNTLQIVSVNWEEPLGNAHPFGTANIYFRVEARLNIPYSERMLENITAAFVWKIRQSGWPWISNPTKYRTIIESMVGHPNLLVKILMTSELVETYDFYKAMKEQNDEKI